MITDNSWQGIIPPVPTAVNRHGEFIPQNMSNLIAHLTSSNVNGLLFLGTAGEFSAMSVRQRKYIAEFCVSNTDSKKPVIIGVASNSVFETIELSQHAQKVGADAVIVVNPSYVKYSNNGLYEYYKIVAGSIDLPLFMYNFPKLTAQPIPVEVVERLVNDTGNIIGIKDTVDEISSTRCYINRIKSKHPNFRVFSGFDEHLANNLLLGGDGAIPSSANFVPDLTCGIFDAFKNKDIDTFSKLHKKIAKLSEMYNIQTPFFPVIKSAINLMGIEFSQDTILPCDNISDSSYEEIKKLLDNLDFIR